MNEFLLVDAITCIDNDLIEKYISMKSILQKKQDTSKKHKIFRWSAIVAACMIVVILATFIIPYIPVRYELNYSYIGTNGQEIYILDSNIWIYYVDGSNMKRERVTLPCTAENIFITWKYLNNIGDDVELIDYEVVITGMENITDFEGESVANDEQAEHFVLNITVSESIRNYGSGDSYEKLITSLEMSMTKYSKIDFAEVHIILE